MLKINKHIGAILDQAVANCGREFELTWGDDHVVVKVQIAATNLEQATATQALNKHNGIARFVTICKENDAKQYDVKFEEISVSPDFITHRSIRTLIAGDPHQLDFACREVYSFLHEDVNLKRIPPQEYVDKWQLINEQWFVNTPFVVQLFLQPSEWGDDWRFKIIHHPSGTEICETLDPKAADGHTYRMLTVSAQKAFERGVLEGQVRAGEALAQNAFNAVFAHSGRRYWNFPGGDEVRYLMEHSTIRTNKTTI